MFLLTFFAARLLFLFIFGFRLFRLRELEEASMLLLCLGFIFTDVCEFDE